MFTRVLAPIPTAVAAAGSGSVHRVGRRDRSQQAGLQPASGSGGSPAATVQKIVLKTGMANGKMVYLDEKGTVNPVLRGKVGETLEITVTSGEGAEHDIVFPELGVNPRSSPARAARSSSPC